jgi:tripeptidyl-peptidase I
MLCLLWLLPTVFSYTPDTESKNAVFRQLDGVPPGWSDDGKPPATLLVSFKIAFSDDRHSSHANEDTSTTSASSGLDHAITAQDDIVTDRMVVEMTYTWLHHNGISNRQIASYGGRWLRVQLSVAQAERLVDADFRIFKRQHDGLRRIGTLNYSIPLALHRHVRSISPVTDFDASASRPE